MESHDPSMIWSALSRAGIVSGERPIGADDIHHWVVRVGVQLVGAFIGVLLSGISMLFVIPGMSFDGGFLLMGLLFLVGAIWTSRIEYDWRAWPGLPFSLAVSATCLLVPSFGHIVRYFDGASAADLDRILYALAFVIGGIAYGFTRDSATRMLATLLLVLFTALLFWGVWPDGDAVGIFWGLISVASSVLIVNEPGWGKHIRVIKPLSYGLAMSLLCAPIASWIERRFSLDGLAHAFVGGQWLLAGSAVYVALRLALANGLSFRKAETWSLLTTSLVAGAFEFKAPGISLAYSAALVGAAYGNSYFKSIAAAYFAVSMAAFICDSSAPTSAKSLASAAVGAAFLVTSVASRFAARRVDRDS